MLNGDATDSNPENRGFDSLPGCQIQRILMKIISNDALLSFTSDMHVKEWTICDTIGSPLEITLTGFLIEPNIREIKEAVVTFGSKNYIYYTFIGNLKEGDEVVTASSNGQAIGQFIKYTKDSKKIHSWILASVKELQYSLDKEIDR